MPQLRFKSNPTTQAMESFAVRTWTEATWTAHSRPPQSVAMPQRSFARLAIDASRSILRRRVTAVRTKCEFAAIYSDCQKYRGFGR
jgi:hypothetical protein